MLTISPNHHFITHAHGAPFFYLADMVRPPYRPITRYPDPNILNLHPPTHGPAHDWILTLDTA